MTDIESKEISTGVATYDHGHLELKLRFEGMVGFPIHPTEFIGVSINWVPNGDHFITEIVMHPKAGSPCKESTAKEAVEIVADAWLDEGE